MNNGGTVGGGQSGSTGANTVSDLVVEGGGSVTVDPGGELASPKIHGTVTNHGTISGTAGNPAVIGDGGTVTGGSLSGVIQVTAGGSIVGTQSNPVTLASGDVAIQLSPGAGLSGVFVITTRTGRAVTIDIPQGATFGQGSGRLTPFRLLAYAAANGWIDSKQGAKAEDGLPRTPEGFELVGGVLLSEDNLRLDGPMTATILFDPALVPADRGVDDVIALVFDPDKSAWIYARILERTGDSVLVETDLMTACALVVDVGADNLPVRLGDVVHQMADPTVFADRLKIAISAALPGADLDVKAAGFVFDVSLNGLLCPMAGAKRAHGMEAGCQMAFACGGMVIAVRLSDGQILGLAPMAADPDGFLALFEQMDPVFDPENGRVILSGPGQVRYVGLFGLAAGAEGSEKTVSRLGAAGQNPWDQDYTVLLEYTDGQSQTLAPGLLAQNELSAWLDAAVTSGVFTSYAICRSTGVLKICLDTGAFLLFKPDYAAHAPGMDELQWFMDNKNDAGLAFEWLDANGDSLPDLEIHTLEGRQVLYQIQP